MNSRIRPQKSRSTSDSSTIRPPILTIHVDRPPWSPSNCDRSTPKSIHRRKSRRRYCMQLQLDRRRLAISQGLATCRNATSRNSAGSRLTYRYSGEIPGLYALTGPRFCIAATYTACRDAALRILRDYVRAARAQRPSRTMRPPGPVVHSVTSIPGRRREAASSTRWA